MILENAQLTKHKPTLNWINDFNLTIQNVNYTLSIETVELQTGTSTPNCFLLGKSKRMVEKVIDIANSFSNPNVFEIGILHGGSVVLYDQILRPNKIVAIEYSNHIIQPLTKYINEHNKNHIIKPYFGVNQADALAMSKILDVEFSEKNIDIVFDDGAHLYAETKAAFNTCFPYVKPGGYYCIEDWGWAHWPGDYWQKGGNEFLADKIPMSNLIIELLILSASRPDLIESIVIDGFRDSSMAIIKRGTAIIHEEKFNIDSYCLTRGETFIPYKLQAEQKLFNDNLVSALTDGQNTINLLQTNLSADELKLRELSEQLECLLNSTSWKITKPLRMMRDLINKSI